MSLIPTVLAHEEGQLVEAAQASIPEVVRSNQIQFTLITIGILFVLTILAILMNKARQKRPTDVISTPTQPVPAESSEAGPAEESEGAWWKTTIFLGLVLVILANTAYLVGSTLYVNFKSASKGPVHWHADFEVWDCGVEIELIDPKPPSNRVGSPLLHEHNDKEIHVEEAFFDERNVSLGAFFIVVGGDLHSDYLKFPTKEGIIERRNGDLCSDGQPGILQVFLYKAGSFNQQKLPNPQDYIMTAEQKVPPGDCVIFEFCSPKEKTDHLCQKYKVKIVIGSFSEKPYELRASHDIASLFAMLGMDNKKIKESLVYIP